MLFQPVTVDPIAKSTVLLPYVNLVKLRESGVPIAFMTSSLVEPSMRVEVFTGVAVGVGVGVAVAVAVGATVGVAVGVAVGVEFDAFLESNSSVTLKSLPSEVYTYMM